MKKFFSANIKWLLLSVLCLLLEGLSDSHFHYLNPEEIYGARIDALIERKFGEFQEIRNDDSLRVRLENKVFDEDLIAYLRSKKVMALKFEEGQLTYWTSVAIDQSISAYQDSVGFGIAQIKRGWYLYENIRNGRNSLMLCYPLYRQYQISNNPLLDDGFNSDLDIQTKADFLFDGQDTKGIRIGASYFNQPVYVSFKNPESPEAPLYMKLLLAFSVIFLGIFLFNCFEFLEHKYSFRWAWLFLLLVLFALRVLSQWLDFPEFLFEYDLFNSEIYRLNQWIPSLGDLLLDTILVFILTFSAFKGVLLVSRDSSRFNWDSLKNRAAHVAMFLWMLVFTAILLGVLQSLINDSTLNFDVTNILDSGALTAVGLLIAAMILTIHFLGVNMMVIMVQRVGMENKKLIVQFLVAVLLFIGLSLLTGLYEYVLTVQSISYLIAVYITYQLVIEQNYFQKTIAILFIVSVFASSLFYRTIHDKEQQHRLQLAERVYSPKDLNAEGVFLDIETKLEY
ncbi:MAG: hypothetical protein LPK45_09000, partial [Bacteroidota bacterium]|nr:hypothetical protein [Bacteroidota bacterium]MDX5431221.1 hypothetical protein [Bacteroidota bacterium]MDX5469960.1 hypothetical protein [Bacteroidota bacterium]